MRVNFNLAGALPSQRIEDQHRNSTGRVGIDALRKRVQRLGGDFIRLPAHLVEILLCVAVDDGDARARREIVEAVKRDLLPGVRQLIGRIRIAIQPRQRSVILRMQSPLRPFAQVALQIGLRGIHAAVKLQIELVVPGGNGDFAGRRRGRILITLGDGAVVPGFRIRSNLFFDRGQVGIRRAEFHLRRNFVRLHPAHALVENVARRPSAVIAHAIKVHQFRQSRRHGARLHQIRGKPHRVQVVVAVAVRKIGKHLAAVGRLPPEELEGQLVGVIPRHLLRYEEIDARLLVNLRQLPVVTKGIRIPADVHIHAVVLLVPALADENGARCRFAVGQIQVRLNPHASHNLPAAFLDALSDVCVDLRILVGEPIVVNCRRLRVSVAGIFLHQLQRG